MNLGKKIVVSAPGKLMLLGEHAVVYGHPCLVTAVNQRIRTTVELLENSDFLLDASDVKIINYKKSIKDIGIGEIPRGAKFVEIAVKNLLNYRHPGNSERSMEASRISNVTAVRDSGQARMTKKKFGVKIVTKSEFSSEFGFGSSSASTVCIIKALSELLKIRLSDKQIFDLAYKTVLDIQGKGSGFDVAAAVYGGTLYFVTGGKVIKKLYSSSEQSESRSLGTIGSRQTRTINLQLIVGYSGIKADTVELMNIVKEKFINNQKEFDKIYNEIEVLVKKAKQKLIAKDFKALGELMNGNQKYLVEFGVSTPKLDVMINAALDAGAYGAKLSGAGGGDCVIAIAPDDKISVVKKAITNAGGQIIDIETNAEGVRIEMRNER